MRALAYVALAGLALLLAVAFLGAMLAAAAWQDVPVR